MSSEIVSTSKNSNLRRAARFMVKDICCSDRSRHARNVACFARATPLPTHSLRAHTAELEVFGIDRLVCIV
ncbi:hypothetical protein EON65_59330 [archaeon]|nr:MAG: hypothetical protein EON65_59330 [archaeon]